MGFWDPPEKERKITYDGQTIASNQTLRWRAVLWVGRQIRDGPYKWMKSAIMNGPYEKLKSKIQSPTEIEARSERETQ